jgi:hypothetical protein
VSAYARPEPLVGLADIDRLEIVVEEGVDAPPVVADPNRRARRFSRGGVEEACQAGPQVLSLKRRNIDVVDIRAAAEVKHDGSPLASRL